MKNTLDFDFKNGDFILKNKELVTLSGAAALRMWIEKILRTQLGRYSIYKGTGYGADIKDLVMSRTYKLSFTESELRRETEKALLKNNDINGITDFSVSRNGSRLLITMTLDTTYSDAEELIYEF